MPGNSNITSPFTSPPSFARDSWPATLDSLGEHLDNLELTFEQQSRHMGTLLAQYKAALAQHRQALSQQFAQPSQLGARTPTWTQRPGGAGASAGSGRTDGGPGPLAHARCGSRAWAAPRLDDGVGEDAERGQ
ncbi:unnamed protein product [Prorocentrum cordatum]|uniref:Uncharacterized protein n=1 Tax=Prorocentrum cordatum TaxID=2364126 RepID=A0ABN9W476_9DINO|nr:unnamed protein product [Polarella glacialis]